MRSLTIRLARVVVPAALAAAWGASALAAGPKTGGNVEISDDLHGGSAGSVGLQGGSVVLDGTIGQTAAEPEALAAGTTVEAGYFSRMVSSQAAILPQMAADSATLAWTDLSPNPLGAQYTIEFSSASNFSFTIFSSVVYNASMAAVAGLPSNTTFYGRIATRYMEGDEEDTPISSYVTLASAPFAGILSNVGPNGFRADWDGNNPVDDPVSWSGATALPAAREGIAAATYGRYVYVSGGRNGAIVGTVYFARVKADGTLGAWQSATALPAPRESHAMVAWGGKLYVIGGSDGAAQQTVWMAPILADGSLGGWSTVGSLPAKRYNLAAVAWDGSIYVSGGINQIGIAQSTLYYASVRPDGTLSVWSTGTALPGTRSGHAMAVSSGTLYVLGGVTGSGVDSTVYYNTLVSGVPGAWSAAASMPDVRTGGAAAGVAGHVVFVGGHDGTNPRSEAYFAKLQPGGALDPWQTNWPSLPAAVWRLGVVNVDERIFALGGSDGALAQAGVSAIAPTGTEYLTEASQDPTFATGVSSSAWAPQFSFDWSGLQPNAVYYGRVRARNFAGVETTLLPLGSTRTLAAVPGAAISTFSMVEVSSIQVQWADGGNPGGTEFRAQASTSADFGGTILASGWTAGANWLASALAVNTSYYFRVQARNAGGLETPFLSLGARHTLSTAPVNTQITASQTTGFTLQWSTGNLPSWTLYEAQASTSPTFATISASSVTFSSMTTFTGLPSAATFYARVRSINGNGVPSLFDVVVSTATGLDATPPAVSTNVAASPNGTPNALLVSWTAPGDDGYVGDLPAGSSFYIQWSSRSPSGVSWSTASAQVVIGTGPVTVGALVSTLVSGLPAESTVTFRVWAKDEANNYSAPSATSAAFFVSPFAFSTIDGASGDTGRAPSVAVDRFGDVHVAYRSSTGDLRYLKRTSGSWGASQQPDPGVSAGELSLAVDNDGNPQIAYRDAGLNRIKIARYAGSWSASAVESGNLSLGGLALDADGRAQISYANVATAELKFASWTGVGWATSTVQTGGSLGRVSGVALAADQSPYIVFSMDGAGSVRVASPTSFGWAVQTFDGSSSASSAPAAAVAGDGRVFIAYGDPINARIRVASATIGGAVTATTLDAGAVAASGGLALDGQGRPVAAYYDGASRDLKYARFNGVSWATGTIDSVGDVGGAASVAIDGSGDVIVAYYDATNGDLKLAQWSAGVPAPAGGNAGSRAQAPSGFAGTAASVTQIQWTWTDNASNELGFALYGALSSTGPFTLVASSAAIGASAGSGGAASYVESGLTAGTTYYRYLVAVTGGGVAASKIASAYPFNTADVSSPTVVDNQPGDAAWRKSNNGVYNVDFLDTGGSKLSKFMVSASTVPGGAGPAVIGFTDVVTAINADTYNTDWALPAAVFNALWEGVTNYITVKAIDGAGNSTVAVDTFYVLKDTTPPSLVDNQPGDNAMRKTGGTTYDVDASDLGSGLAGFEYSVSTTPASADGSVLGWTPVASVNGSSYTTDWQVAFNTLASATNYVSVRAFDVAANTATATDVFYVLKDTVGPVAVITAPGPGFVSTLPLLKGTASDAFGVQAVEVAIRANGTGLYWDGFGFTSAGAVFFTASGGSTWQYGPGIGWTTGSAYDVIARATDTAGNFSTSYATTTFTFDASTPTIGVVVPAPSSVISSLSSISGTAADVGAGLASVEVQLRRNSDGKWWNWFADAWTTVAVSTVASGTTNWSVGASSLLQANLADQTSYFIAARASDGAVPSNKGDFFLQGATFTFSDATPPAAVGDLLASSSAVSGRIDFSWTAPGDDGASGTILQGYFRIQYSTFTPFTFSSAAAQVVIATGNVVPGSRRGYTLTNLVAGVTYYAELWTADDAGNWSAASNMTSVMAGPPLNNRIAGRVVKVSSEGITAVQVDCYDQNNTLISSTFTVADGSGSYTLDNIPQGFFRVQAAWSVNGIVSSVWQDGIVMGASTVDFVLNLDYTLSQLTGTLQALAAPQGVGGKSGFLALAEGNNFAGSKVELFSGGRKAVEVAVSPTGRWNIPNLLPGKYGVRAYNGVAYTDTVEVDLAEGELKEVGFVYNPLPEPTVFAFPNPARDSVTFRFESPLAPLEAQVLVFDIAGQLVKELAGGEMTSPSLGRYHAKWDLTNSRGEPVASGVYLFMVKVRGGSENQTAKVVKKLAVVR